MNIKPSTALRNNYLELSSLAHETGEPIYITNKGEADLVIMSIEAYEEQRKLEELKMSILQSEAEILAGAKTYTLDEAYAALEEIYNG